MLDKIMDMVGDQAISAMTEKAGISADQAKSMLPLAGESLQEGLLSKVTGGGLDDVLGMFKSFSGGGLENNGLFGSIKGMFMQKIMTNMGLPESVAGLVSGSGMSSIVGSLTDKIKGHGDTDDIDAASLMGVLGGGDGGVLGAITGMLGGNKGGDDKGGLGGALGDIAGGLFGK